MGVRKRVAAGQPAAGEQELLDIYGSDGELCTCGKAARSRASAEQRAGQPALTRAQALPPLALALQSQPVLFQLLPIRVNIQLAPRCHRAGTSSTGRARGQRDALRTT